VTPGGEVFEALLQMDLAGRDYHMFSSLLDQDLDTSVRLVEQPQTGHQGTHVSCNT